MTSIYEAPDIRKQTIDDAAANINQKRVARMMLAMKAQTTIKERTSKIHAKDVARFEKAVETINKRLVKIADEIEATQRMVSKLNELNHNIVNAEGVMFDVGH